MPPLPQVEEANVASLAEWLAAAPQQVDLLVFASGVNYQKRHIPAAWFALRSQLAAALAQLPAACSAMC